MRLETIWKQIFEFAKDIFLLQRDSQQNKEDIKKLQHGLENAQGDMKQLRAEFNQLVLLVQKLSFEIQRVDER